MQIQRFTYHFNSFNLLFKAISNSVQNIAFEKNISVPTFALPACPYRAFAPLSPITAFEEAQTLTPTASPFAMLIEITNGGKRSRWSGFACNATKSENCA